MLLPFTEEFTRPPDITEALDRLSNEKNDVRGAIFTDGSVVEAILDLVGYKCSYRLDKLRLLEPSFGEGEFLVRAVKRLVGSYFAHGGTYDEAQSALENAILGVEIHLPSYEKTKALVHKELLSAGLSHECSQALVEKWLVQDDFLLHETQGEFHFVIGNPPYVRQERIPAPLLKEYRHRYKTMYDRADLYIPFYEKCLDLLAPDGCLGFVCANRWLKNKYGGPLREKIANRYHLEHFIDLENVDAFDREVLAYPCITVIRRYLGHTTRVALKISNDLHDLEDLVKTMSKTSITEEDGVVDLPKIACGRDPWLLDSPYILRTIRALEGRFPTLEQAGCKVTIGVATGCDRVFIGDYEQLPVEAERKLPLVMASDLRDGMTIDWSKKGIVNPFIEGGSLASLIEYPRFAHYLKEHEVALQNRHVAKKNPTKWYRTIDRIYPSLTQEPKLLIPDIKGDATVVLDEGHYYPHHNLYVITSTSWNLRALQAILRSSIGLMFVAAYSVRMSGGFLRFQAQYLRRIRIPHWEDLSPETCTSLESLSQEPERERIDETVLPLYELSGADIKSIVSFAHDARVKKAS